jgi:hypothetical protein
MDKQPVCSLTNYYLLYIHEDIRVISDHVCNTLRDFLDLDYFGIEYRFMDMYGTNI